MIRSAPVTDAAWQGIYHDVVEGWLTFVEQLRFALERHRGADRRTLYLNGRAQAAGAALPEDALGLHHLAAVPAGERYSLMTAMGDAMEGTVWFRSPSQVGLTVDAYGDGLIVVGTRPRTANSAYGGGSLVITTYGMNDAVFAGLRERWSGWWRSRYEVIELAHG